MRPVLNVTGGSTCRISGKGGQPAMRTPPVIAAAAGALKAPRPSNSPQMRMQHRSSRGALPRNSEADFVPRPTPHYQGGYRHGQVALADDIGRTPRVGRRRHHGREAEIVDASQPRPLEARHGSAWSGALKAPAASSFRAKYRSLRPSLPRNFGGRPRAQGSPHYQGGLRRSVPPQSGGHLSCPGRPALSGRLSTWPGACR
jgi:hypothetical protein